MSTIIETGDEEADKKARAAALEAVLKYQADEGDKMKALRRAANKLLEELGEDDDAYLAASAKYYRQKAVFEEVEKIIATTNANDS